jgi:hypothetical protein
MNSKIGVHNLQYFDKHDLKNYRGNKLCRCLTINSPQKTYEPRCKHDLRTTMHWGQRKLLMTEIDFLTQYSKENDLVLYVGAAPAIHTPLLSKLFPTLKFILIDPMKFSIHETDNIQIRKEYFTDEKAKEFIGKDFLFICDIRVSNNEKNYKPTEDEVKMDMLIQQKWVEIMKPKFSILKFRLPWDQETFEYLDGNITIQPWGPQSSTETRLIIDNSLEKRLWNCKIYENQMYYFNTITRCQYFPHNIIAPGIDHCYDCSSEIYIIKNYLKLFQPNRNNEKMVIKFIHKISKHLTKGEGSLSGYYYYKYIHSDNYQRNTVKYNLINLIHQLNIAKDTNNCNKFKKSFKEIKNLILNESENNTT